MDDSTGGPGASAQPTGVVRLLLLAVVATAAVAVGVTALLINIFERKQEAKTTFVRVVDVTDDTEDPAVWGKNFPLEYDSYLKTVDQVRTRHGGSEALPRSPSTGDPRAFVSRSKIDEDPRLKVMWAGYAFAKDFREERGHAYMLEDQIYTQRQVVAQQPGTCLHCHASVYVPYRKLGNGDLIAGFEKLNPMPYQEARKLVTHPVACVDCHDPKTMQLRVTRPGFLEGMRAFKASQGVQGYDVNRHSTRQEMRSYVCGQCHVEYYFKGKEKRLTYPWHKGLGVDDIYAYYQEIGFKDWQHAETGAPTLKAQHPEFELYNQGIHARAGVACADCHMPYRREGAMKVADHHVRCPVLNINRACQSCHHWPEEELKARVEIIQQRFTGLRNVAMDALVDLIGDLKAARAAGRTDPELEKARQAQRKAQFYLDFVEAETAGRKVRTLTNSPGRSSPLAGRVDVHPFDFDDPGKLCRALQGAAVLYNTYWVRFNHLAFSHARAVENTTRLFEAAREAGVSRVVHVSITRPSLDSELEYFRGKAALEKTLGSSGLSHAILRPAVLFGREDILINNIAWMLRRFPVFGVFGDGRYRLQPIFVDDLASLAVAQGSSRENVVLDAIGPETFAYRDLVTTIGAAIGRTRPIIEIPPWAGLLFARLLGPILGDVIITPEEVTGLMSDLLCTDSAPTGTTKLTDWLRVNAATVGHRYSSELARRRDRVRAYDLL
ncbi:MAG: ammonia-forming cytochrome c nitrite reductase subunit c552 [Candidatus Riflebacteria bacterium]|nr:ammonia-forming cytochrome c nitrite reductase subunit c552 [Candidatus Riflebacteria bacterium]